MSLTLPTPPPGFDTDISLTRTSPISPIGVYEIGIEYMFLLAFSFQWTQTRAASGIDHFHPPGSVAVILLDNTEGLMENGHAISALYRSLFAIVETNAYCVVTTTLILQGQKIATLKILPAFPAPVDAIVRVSNDTTASPIPTNSARDSSGKIASDVDSRLIMSYQYDGARVDSRDIWTAVLDDIVETAYNGANSTFSHIDAVSASGDAVYHMHTTAGVGTCKYWYMAEALRLMFIKMVISKRFQEVKLEIEYDGKTIAEGWLLKMKRAQNNSTPLVGLV